MTPEFDRASRHILVARAVRALADPPGPILDVGGSQGYTKAELPNYDVVTIDLDSSADIVASVERLPLRDRSFAVVVALDLLEHLPKELRHRALEEMSRISSKGMVVVGPFDGPEVRAEEGAAALFYETVTGRAHRWLLEHRDYGLPDLDVTLASMDGLGWTTSISTTNPTRMWRSLQRLNFVAAEFDVRRDNVHSLLLRSYLEDGDQDLPAYRTVLMSSRTLLDGQPSLRDGTVATPLSTTQAVEIIDAAVVEILGEVARERKRSSRQHDQVRAAFEETRGLASHTQGRIETLEGLFETAQQELEAARSEVDDLRAAVATAEGRIQRERRIFRRIAEQVDGDARRIESSASWRVGRLLLSPTRLFGNPGVPGPVAIQRRLRSFVRTPIREARESRVVKESPTSPVVEVTTDLKRLLASKRLQAGNKVGNLFEGVTKRSGERADLRLARLLDDLVAGQETGDEEVLRSLQEIGAELSKLERSRRWRMGQMVGDLVALGRTGPTPAIVRLRSSVPRAISYLEDEALLHESDGPEDPEYVWGGSLAADVRERDAIYRRYVANVEEVTLDGLRASSTKPASILILIDAR